MCNPVFRVVTSWLWFIVGGVLVTLIILAGYGLNFAEVIELLGERRYLAVYIEIVSVGLLPLVLTLICRDNLMMYGLGLKGLRGSVSLSRLFVVVLFYIALLARGQLMSGLSPSPHLNFPWNIWYVIPGVFAWGPLEVFFFFWLVANTDRIFKSVDKIVSWGLILTVVIFSLAHILTTDIFNALYTGALFLILGLIYKYTKNSIGPIIAWTLVNGQVWFMVGMLWS